VRGTLWTAALAAILVGLALPRPGACSFSGFDPRGTGPGYPDCANGRRTEPPSLPAHRIANGGVHIDGRLDETDWAQAPAAGGFTQFEPDRRGEPSEETVFKVLYDEDAIYFGVACCRRNGCPVASCLSRRDRIVSSDLIRLYISPYNDLVTGYHFRINPDGVKEDYYNYGDLYHDVSWDAVWDADTYVDEDGWYAEIRLPFSSIRYRPAPSMTWGCNVFQHILAHGERTAWSNWNRDQNGFMSRSGTITGIEHIRAPRQLEVVPYAVSSLTDPADPSGHGFAGEERGHAGSFGADFKYGVTADLTLNATVQPDFGQVEADPSQLNLSPYETYYDEKRPFFIEGAQFFWHPDFTVFYSRRIGTGSENSRIRFAGKLTGKMAGDVATAVLVAATDETGAGRAHNTLQGGRHKAVYAIGRFGKQFHGGLHSVNVMQTAVVRDADSFDAATRNGYVTGGDFELNFRDRMYQATGSFVGSIVDRLRDPEQAGTDPDPTYGTGSRFEIEKTSGDWRFALTTRHQSDELDLNDLGYINNPNHYAVQAWVTRVFNADDDESFVTNKSIHARYYQSWIYADRTFCDPGDPGRTLWSYDRGHDLLRLWHFEASLATRSTWGAWCGLDYQPTVVDLYGTRWTPAGSARGPLMKRPADYNVWVGGQSDTRRDFWVNPYLGWSGDEAGSRAAAYSLAASWVQSSRLTHQVSVSYEQRHADAQWLGNFANPGGGIGGASYVFAELDQRTWDLTLRSSLLFSRDASLELYVQPYLTVGDYASPRELARPDSYDFAPYPDLDAAGRDFAYGAVNLNLVYRWEYRPGSTLYLVWAHTRGNFDRRGWHTEPGAFENGFGLEPLVDNEGENRFMIKMSYWLPL